MTASVAGTVVELKRRSSLSSRSVLYGGTSDRLPGGEVAASIAFTEGEVQFVNHSPEVLLTPGGDFKSMTTGLSSIKDAEDACPY